MSEELSGGQGKPRAPEPWPESSWGVLERPLRLTSASVNDKLGCACVGGCGAGREVSGQVQGALRRCKGRPELRNGGLRGPEESWRGPESPRRGHFN